MKVVLCQTLCRPEGNGFKGTVLDIGKDERQTCPDPNADPQSGKTIEMPLGDFLVQNKMAVPFNPSIHSKLKQHGLVRAER
jgi:hypothetical protein